jgi:hypothetical protein
MKFKSTVYGPFVVVLAGCSGGQPDATQTPGSPATVSPSATKQVRVTGIQRMNFANGDSALVLNYETDIPIEDKPALRKEVDEIWQRFQKDVEKAGVNSGVIRATHYENTGIIRKGNGFGFIFVKGTDGKWQLQDDKKK